MASGVEFLSEHNGLPKIANSMIFITLLIQSVFKCGFSGAYPLSIFMLIIIYHWVNIRVNLRCNTNAKTSLKSPFAHSLEKVLSGEFLAYLKMIPSRYYGNHASFTKATTIIFSICIRRFIIGIFGGQWTPLDMAGWSYNNHLYFLPTVWIEDG